MRGFLPLIISVLLLGACTEDDPTTIGGNVSIKDPKLIRNQLDMQHFNEIGPESVSLQSTDTVTLTYSIDVDLNHSTGRIDSIEYRIAPGYIIANYDRLSSTESLDEVLKALTKTSYPDLPIGNHTHEIKQSFFIPNNSIKKSLKGDFTNWLNEVIIHFSVTEEYDFVDGIFVESLRWNAQIQPERKTKNFRIYNNYVGKNFNDSTGVGFSISENEFVHDPCHLFKVDEAGNSCGAQIQDVLVNLTYNAEINVDGKIFIPHIGFSQYTLTHNDRQNTDTYLSKFRVYRDGIFFDWDRLEFVRDQSYLDESELRYEYIEPQIDKTYTITHPSNKYSKQYFRVVKIVDDGEESYVEFERVITD